jgi:hypothetical protein
MIKVIRARVFVLACALLLWGSGTLLVPNASAQAPNLLRNPGFEVPYYTIPGKENCRIAEPWVWWYVEGAPEQVSRGYLLAPEYKPAFRQDAPGNRVRNGERAQQYFHSWGNFQAGLWQQVTGVTVGSRLRFSIWAMTWSCDREGKGNCAGATSGDPSTMHLRIGIDPTGGSDVFSKAIVWSREENAYDAWIEMQAEATARADKVTVFVYAYPEYRSQDNNVYLDDASLVALGAAPTDTPRATNTAVATVAPATAEPTRTSSVTPTATPKSTDVPTATTKPTDMPTATTKPTDMPTPTARPTDMPTATPLPSPKPTEALLATTVPPITPSSAATEPPAGPNLWVLAGIVAVVIMIALVVVLRRRPS